VRQTRYFWQVKAWGRLAAGVFAVVPEIPQYIAWYDPDAWNGRGRVGLVEGLRDAKSFSTREQALLDLERVPRDWPRLPDGSVNRPILRRAEVEIVAREVEVDFGTKNREVNGDGSRDE